MAIFRVVLATLLISLLLLNVVHADMVTSNDATKIDCKSRCQERCRLSSRQKICHRACGTCCARCNCVPPGTFGNYDKCKCYASLKTHGGRPKCP